MNYSYKCYTAQGSWGFDAPTDVDAMRLALFYAWRDGEGYPLDTILATPILITESTCEVSNGDENLQLADHMGGKPNTVKFTWRDRQPPCGAVACLARNIHSTL